VESLHVREYKSCVQLQHVRKYKGAQSQHVREYKDCVQSQLVRNIKVYSNGTCENIKNMYSYSTCEDIKFGWSHSTCENIKNIYSHSTCENIKNECSLCPKVFLNVHSTPCTFRQKQRVILQSVGSYVQWSCGSRSNTALWVRIPLEVLTYVQCVQYLAN
jgi:hypothetical protein